MIFSDQSAIVHISGNMADLGKILKTNKGAVDIFGYPKKELLSSNVNILMPRLISTKHTSYLESYIKTGRTRLLYSQKKMFGRDAQGFLVPLWVVVKQYNQPQGLIEYVGLMKPLD